MAKPKGKAGAKEAHPEEPIRQEVQEAANTIDDMKEKVKTNFGDILNLVQAMDEKLNVSEKMEVVNAYNDLFNMVKANKDWFSKGL